MANLSTTLLMIIGAIFIFQMVSDGITEALIFVPSLAFQEPWRFVTSMFLHGGLMHLFFNAYALFLFGSILERKVSRQEYLLIYFGAGLVGGVAYYLTYVLGIIPSIPALGASGAIYGLLGAVAVLLPNLRIFVWFIPMTMRQAAILWLVVEFLGTFNISSGIASAAHLGGLVFGLIFAWYLKKSQADEFSDPWAYR
ncbi:rhomboid family intramembrane serine protease [Candidatus Micrarchaeota archaeon]|nr:rhomboid family intramembrane serine protease [Candidatus Micrarchaeota archaeon]